MKLEKRPIFQPFKTPLSPISALFCACVLILGVIFSQTIAAVSAFLLLGIILSLYNKALKRLARLILPINGFILVVWLVFPFTIPDPAPTTIPYFPFSLSYAGIRLAFLLTLKTNATLLFLVNFVSIEPHKLGRLLQTVGAPDKLIALYILLYQHIGFLYKDFLTALQSLSLRLQKKPRILLSLKLYACLIGTALVHNIDRADYIRMVLERRESPLLYVQQEALRSSPVDVVAPLAVVAFTFAAIYCLA